VYFLINIIFFLKKKKEKKREKTEAYVWSLLFALQAHNKGTTPSHSGRSQCVESTPYEGRVGHTQPTPYEGVLYPVV